MATLEHLYSTDHTLAPRRPTDCDSEGQESSELRLLAGRWRMISDNFLCAVSGKIKSSENKRKTHSIENASRLYRSDEPDRTEPRACNATRCSLVNYRKHNTLFYSRSHCTISKCRVNE